MKITSRKRGLFVLAMFIGLVFVAIQPGWPFATGPKVVFKTETWNFGNIKDNVHISQDFVFTNVGDAVLIITKVDASCGCTAVLVTDKKIEPGKMGMVKVKFDSSGYEGEVSKVVYVETNDPSKPRIALNINGFIEAQPGPRIELDPLSFGAGLLLEGEVIVTNVSVKNAGQTELSFECRFPPATFLIDDKPAVFPVKVAPGKGVRLQIKLPLGKRIGIIREIVLFNSNDSQRRTISMTISGYAATKDELKKAFQKHQNAIKQ